ncbi:alkane hydroxylase MAH1-like [Vigna radiata var. radiata]|uniref:Alkane hydroxylase MAH1-like n=1 Tax=Vigna radiata var. radiata TaxID=3916 RepID=A0A1S3UJU7_VIGRR|nr:alkane hydroxylase MAH1-like [Vigna radiata var. radiata]
MAFLLVGYAGAATIAALLCMLRFFYLRRCCSNPIFTEYPFVGMLPHVLCNLWHAHDYSTQVLKQHGGTGEFVGPWFTGMNYMLTCDPLNVHHMLSKNFRNYVKGPEFREIFQAFGDGIFTADAEAWKYSRDLFHSLLKHKSFEVFLEKTIQKKVQNSLLPLLNHVQDQGRVVDLQDVFNRFTFDNICSTVLGRDPECLSIDFPEVAIEKAFNQAEESIFYRHVVPGSVWKLQKWLQIGQEKKMTESCIILDEFIYSCIASKREDLSRYEENETGETFHVDLLTTLMREGKGKGEAHEDIFLRDAVFNLFVAGRDTITSALTWFFWLVATNPLVEAKIVEEMNEKFGSNEKTVLSAEEVKKLVYLHGAMCETLRLFPPIPFERKKAIEADVLPSGHGVNPRTKILLFLYAMGRVEEIWGEDCMEMKPERWISEKGGIVHVPSYKFIAFNAGPRNCLGKDLSFIQLKMVAAAILRSYHVQLVEGYVATPTLSIVLLMKDGLKVNITKRKS